jgi:hypothetical protein
MSTPVRSTVGAFLLGILIMVLLVASGAFDGMAGRFWYHGLVHRITSDRLAPLIVSVGSADDTRDGQCPPVFHVFNETNRDVYFQISGSASDSGSDDSNAGRYQYSHNDGQQPYGNNDDDEDAANKGRAPNGAPPDRDADNEPLTLHPGQKIKADRISGYGRRPECPRSDVRIRVTN